MILSLQIFFTKFPKKFPESSIIVIDLVSSSDLIMFILISIFFFFCKAFAALGDNPNIAILGNDTASRLPIFSIIIYHQDSGKLVHHNFVSVLLNDLYGIQARGGCACAGPYAQASLILLSNFCYLGLSYVR